MKIIDRLPFADRPQIVTVRGEPVDVYRNQIIVWISIEDVLKPLPAILDTGHGHNFSISIHRHANTALVRPFEPLCPSRPPTIRVRPTQRSVEHVFITRAPGRRSHTGPRRGPSHLVFVKVSGHVPPGCVQSPVISPFF
jgi:hypothetical protein